MLKKEEILRLAPTTRYQGSKRRILPWIYENLKSIDFKTVLDGFGGTGSVSYLFKLMGKEVTFNDILLANYMTGLAIIDNDFVTLSKEDINFLLQKNGFIYPCFIENNFKRIYYTSQENRMLDTIIFNIKMLSKKYRGDELKKKRALAYHILFQACLCKRPFNLFHRRNLYIRTAKNIKRTFGNKRTWDTSFAKLLRRFNKEISQKIFSNGIRNKAICQDLLKLRSRNYDLVYLDPPYARKNEIIPKNYHNLYHFLDGLVDYKNWSKNIDLNTLNKRMIMGKNLWSEGMIVNNFETLFKKFRKSIVVISYGEPGNPSISTIKNLLLKYKSTVKTVKRNYKYRLNSMNGHGLREVLLIGQ